jgi:hypothetical protein
MENVMLPGNTPAPIEENVEADEVTCRFTQFLIWRGLVEAVRKLTKGCLKTGTLGFFFQLCFGKIYKIYFAW